MAATIRVLGIECVRVVDEDDDPDAAFFRGERDDGATTINVSLTGADDEPQWHVNVVHKRTFIGSEDVRYCVEYSGLGRSLDDAEADAITARLEITALLEGRDRWSR